MASPTFDAILTQIDAVTAPAMMTKKEAFAFLEDLIAEIESKMDALAEEMANDDIKEEDGKGHDT